MVETLSEERDAVPTRARRIQKTVLRRCSSAAESSSLGSSGRGAKKVFNQRRAADAVDFEHAAAKRHGQPNRAAYANRDPGAHAPKADGAWPLPAHLPRIDICVLPKEVEEQGTDAFFEQIGRGRDRDRRAQGPASLVVVRTHKPKFVPKDRNQIEERARCCRPRRQSCRSSAALPVRRFCGRLDIARRWQDHLPLHRLERIYGREGLELARSTICGNGTLRLHSWQSRSSWRCGRTR